MRYGIFSDVHSNLEAFQKSITWYKNQAIDKYVFLGDIIGYAANPNEVISLLQQLYPVVLAGNHDWAVIDKHDISCFNPYARKALLWTKNILSGVHKDYLRSFSLVYEEENFSCVHASLLSPEQFRYISNYHDALLNFKVMDRNVCFIGHSHRAESYMLKARVVSYSKQDRLSIDCNTKYIINVGSVGQPRDRDSKGCLCIYDSDEKVVIFNRFEYNIKKAAGKIIKAGLPSILADRLYLGY